MDPTGVMMDEHRAIKRVLDCLEKMLSECRTEGRLAREPAADAVHFLRHFADRAHHGKEEAIFFPVMEDLGLTKEKSLIGDLIDQHVQGRAHVKAMEDAIDGAAAGETVAVRDFVAQAGVYVRMLRRHIRMEDDFLFPMADVSLGMEETRKMLDAFERTDGSEEMKSEREACLRIADRLAERYGVERPDVASGESTP